uniref:BED-type domain-containing protein n=1 Tax=Triticum urartu TaxID=4572 RepID=A0A8R7QF93_TRIUA
MSECVNLSAGYAAGQRSLRETEPDVTPDSVSKKRNKRSKTWTHFTIQNDDPDHANCNYCSVVLGCKSTSAGTSSLVNHLKICKKNPASIGRNHTELTFQVCAD